VAYLRIGAIGTKHPYSGLQRAQATDARARRYQRKRITRPHRAAGYAAAEGDAGGDEGEGDDS
jgi:hypothetical protein